MANIFDQYEVWWVTGAQLLYGGETVKIVDGHSKEMVDGLNNSGIIPIKVVYKGTANSSKEVEAVMKAANNDEKCVGIITWMHTFSPAKMWIKGLQALQKPLLHFHTQYNAEIPWETIDMDFMNLNQSAHGDIEFGHICTRLLRFHRLKNNDAYRERMEINSTDERLHFIRSKAWAWAGYLFILISSIGIIAFQLAGQELLSQAAAWSVCLMLILFWGSYMVLKKKY